MSGISLWMSDLGGYNKKARFPGDDILFARWTQYSAFSPGMEVMSGMNLGPWDYGKEALDIFRRYAVLHMSLFPYRYAAAQESARNGLPMMRALALMHQDDANAREAATEYYFGPDLLIAPVLAPVTQRSVYLPEGNWIDYWTGKRLGGRQTLAADAPLDRIPVYVREGAILPKIPDDVMTLASGLDGRRVYELYPGGPARPITDFEDRTVAPGPGSLAITGQPAHVILRWRFQNPTGVTVNGRAVRVTGSPPAVEFEHEGASRIEWR
jgi:alpha-D-xyloside xylohydrolase